MKARKLVTGRKSPRIEKPKPPAKQKPIPVRKDFFVGSQSYFPEVKKPIAYEGPDTKNPLAFRYYNPTRVVGGQTMAEHLRFSMAFWHTIRGTGADIFGGGVYDRLWNRGSSPMVRAEHAMEAAFEFMTKIGINYWCFHDRDIAPQGENIAATNKNLAKMVAFAKKLQERTGIRLLWGTANLFSDPIYSSGAFTNPVPLVFGHAASQVMRAIDATVELGGRGYVFWGGREGYYTHLNTDLNLEQRNLARALRMAVDYKKQAGFTGSFFIEPKPMEPTKHQYDFDAATTLYFLARQGLLEHFALNIEANHATLAGHSFAHELFVASQAGKLGSVDANRGDPQLGWDTDQFPVFDEATVMAMCIILKQGGLPNGGLNFDAKLRRDSTDPSDLFHAHIGGMDAYARALLVAQKMREDGRLSKLVSDRYAGFREGMGLRITGEQFSDRVELTLPTLEAWAAEQGRPELRSGRQESFENILQAYMAAPVD